MRKYSTIILLLLISPAFAADLFDFEKEYDSLARVLPFATGTERVDILCEMAFMLAPWEPQQSQPLVDEAFALARELNYQIGIGKAWQMMAEIAYYSDNYIKAMDYYNRAVSIFRKTGEKYMLVKCLGKIGAIYLLTGNTEKSWENVPEIFEFYEKEEILDEVATMYFLEGFYHNYISKDAEAGIEVLRKALALAFQEKMPTRYLGSYSICLAIAFSMNGQTDSASKYFHKGLILYNEDIIADRVFKTNSLWEYSHILGATLKPDSTLYYLREAFTRADNMSFIYGKFMISIRMGNYFFKKNEFQEAEKYYKLAVENALKVNTTGRGFLDEAYKWAPIDFWDMHYRFMSTSMLKIEAKQGLSNLYLKLSTLMEISGKPSEGLEYYKLYHAYSDTLNKVAADKQLLGLEIAYESERKTQQIGMLEQQTELQQFRIRQNSIFLYGLIALIILLILFATLFFRQNRIKANQQNIQLKQRLFRSQMNPHFIFNSLASIQNSIINEDPMKASKYLARFSKLVRNILDSSAAETITLEDEINTIENYLTLQKIRYPEMINFTISVDEGLDVEATLIPPMLAQPFIENAIEHGLKSKEVKGNIDVRFIRKNQTLVLEIEDDGIGREKAQENLQKQNSDHKSMATSITQERIKVLNRKLQHKIKLEIFDLKDNQNQPVGTLVKFDIPVT
jgi:tetratricopeptide (TPR) repeat protein